MPELATDPRRFTSRPLADATLVVGFDGSPGSRAAIEWASRMADGDRLVIVGVAPPASTEAQRIGAAMRALPAMAALTDAAWAPEKRQGWSAADVLVRAAHEHGAGAIVVGAHGHDPSHLVLGSVAHRLLRVSDVPVVVVPDPAGRSVVSRTSSAPRS